MKSMLKKVFFSMMSLMLFMVVFLDIAAGQSSSISEPLNVLLTVKETAGTGANKYPVTAIVPLEEGRYQEISSFRVADVSGTTVPAQFEVLNRWWGKDSSIRHVAVHFQPTVPAFTGSGSGMTTYYLKDDGNGNYSPSPIVLTETSSEITVNTGVLKFTVQKNSFNILDQVWLDINKNRIFEATEKMLSSSPVNGGVFVPRQENTTGTQYDSSRTDVNIDIEESGPMRVVIRAEALTKYNSTTDHTHGWAVRIYAYAGKPYIKIDYQLQNSAKNVVYSWPLYFESMNMNFKLNLEGNPTVKFGTGDSNVYERARNDGLYLAQKMHDKFEILDTGDNTLHSGTIPDGLISINDGQKGVTAITRNFWQMWPNGLKIDRDNTLSIQLFPEWSQQFYHNKENGTYELNTTGLYWLEDMQHVYKETLLFFHQSVSRNTELIDLAKTFQYHPVAVIPSEQYQKTKATLDLGGMIPDERYLGASTENLRRPSYISPAYDTSSSARYQFGWDNFKVDVARKWSPESPGGWPYGNAKFIASGNPADYFNAEDFAMGELNVRPQWMSAYNHDNDWSFLKLTSNPYAGGSWRYFKGWPPYGDPWFDAPYLQGTSQDAKARDNQHGWFCHVEEAYYTTGNPWIKDWYEFIAEFRQTTLLFLDPFPIVSSRGMGHGSVNATQAYRVTGNPNFIPSFRDFITFIRSERQDFIYGDNDSHQKTEAAFQTGFLARSIINFMEEVRGNDWQAYAEGFQLLSGFMAWNLNYSNFAYYLDASNGTIGKSSGSGLSLIDPQMWYYWNTGKKEYLDHAEKYIKSGINGGSKPYGNFKTWEGQYEGRYYLFAQNTERNDTTPPAPVNDLQATRSASKLILTWTAPPDNDLERYHLVWSTKPISEIQTMDSTKINWWAANVVGPDLIPTPGEQQTFTISSVPDEHIYAAIFSFDKAQNMSKMSNLPPDKKTLIITKEGAGSVSSDPSGIDCGNVCQTGFNEGTVVTLTATPATGSFFAGWSGACHADTGQCKVTMIDARNVSAKFEELAGDVVISKKQEFEFDRGGEAFMPFVYSGDNISYNISAANLFNTSVSLLISDALDALVEYIEGTLKVDGETIDNDLDYFHGNLLEYESDPLLTDQSLSISFDVRVIDDASLEAIIENSASVSVYFASSDTGIMSKSSNPVQAQVQEPVPEPSTVIFFGIGLFGLLSLVRKKRKNKKSQ